MRNQVEVAISCRAVRVLKVWETPTFLDQHQSGPTRDLKAWNHIKGAPRLRHLARVLFWLSRNGSSFESYLACMENNQLLHRLICDCKLVIRIWLGCKELKYNFGGNSCKKRTVNYVHACNVGRVALIKYIDYS